MMTLSIDGSSMPQRRETGDCYHLVTLKSACRLQLFAAKASRCTRSMADAVGLWTVAYLFLIVLDLFYRPVMFSP
jgi:hypothetical protein